MKKIFFSLSILLFVVPGFSQVFKPVKIDSLVTVSMPATYQQKDTLNQQIFSAQGAFGYIMVIRVANAKNNTPLHKEKDLNKVFKDYIKDVQLQSGNGTILNTGDTVVGTLKARVFTLQTDNGTGSLQLRKFIFLYTQDASYTFEYYYKAITSYLIGDELHEFTSSIKLSPELQRNDQYTSTGKSAATSHTLMLSLIGGGLVIVIIIVAVTIRRKRKKRNKRNGVK
jgi:hypothetical protein